MGYNYRLFLYLDFVPPPPKKKKNWPYFVSELRKLSALVQNCADNLHLAD